MDPHPPTRLNAAPSTRRPPTRAQRHPNSVTAPPIRRGAMPAHPWRGFWNSTFLALLSTAAAASGRPAQRRAARGAGALAARADRRRFVFALLTLLSTGIASWLFAQAQPDYGNPVLAWGQIALLFAILSAWVVTAS